MQLGQTFMAVGILSGKNMYSHEALNGRVGLEETDLL